MHEAFKKTVNSDLGWIFTFVSDLKKHLSRSNHSRIIENLLRIEQKNKITDLFYPDTLKEIGLW